MNNHRGVLVRVRGSRPDTPFLRGMRQLALPMAFSSAPGGRHITPAVRSCRKDSRHGPVPPPLPAPPAPQAPLPGGRKGDDLPVAAGKAGVAGKSRARPRAGRLVDGPEVRLEEKLEL